MDFMNENQAAHGDREWGHIVTRMGIERKVVVGHWSDPVVQEKIASWQRVAVGVVESSWVTGCARRSALPRADMCVLCA